MSKSDLRSGIGQVDVDQQTNVRTWPNTEAAPLSPSSSWVQ
jgi:hypothetical protein